MLGTCLHCNANTLPTHPRPYNAMMHCPSKVILATIFWIGSSAMFQPLGAFAQVSTDGKVMIEGGADETGHNYRWTVTNQYRSPIVRIQFAHYNADLFFAPDGWSTGDTTNLINVGVTDPNGVCVAAAPSPRQGIAFRGSAAFGVRVAPAGADTGEGIWRVRFADGTMAEVEGVQLPVPRATGDKFVALIGSALVFGIIVIAESIRRRRQPSS